MSTTLEAQLDADPRALIEFEKIRFELAWRHFDLHARQRTTMFHFFILLVPFVFGGCFFLFKEREVVGSFPAIVAAGAGALLALIFSLLDLRNKQLYGVSKEALGLIEEQFLFALYRPLKISGSNYPGVITTEAQRYGHNNLLKHSLLMGGVYWLTLLMFLVLAGYFVAVRQGCILSCQCRALHQRLTSKWTFRDYTLALRDAIYKRSQFCSH